jgi:regulator of protease activity HflC (stomatin/prohibitin superfamily)
MKKLLYLIPALVIVLGLSTGCSRISPGHVGIVVHQAGADRGVQSYPAVTGWQFYNPLTTSILEYPTFIQTVVWTKDKTEGSETNEEISFSTSEGTTIYADVAVSYELQPDRVPQFYVKFRNDDLRLFTHGFLRNLTRNAFNDAAGQHSVEQIYGAGKEQLLKDVVKNLNTALTKYGVLVDQVNFVSTLRLPGNIVQSINNKIKATQDAITAQNELQITQAEAAKSVAEAEGHAKARIAEAEGQAKSQAALQSTITSQVLELERLKVLQKWDGKLPETVLGSGTIPFPVSIGGK